jgi:hypothetical protein
MPGWPLTTLMRPSQLLQPMPASKDFSNYIQQRKASLRSSCKTAGLVTQSLRLQMSAAWT